MFPTVSNVGCVVYVTKKPPDESRSGDETAVVVAKG